MGCTLTLKDVQHIPNLRLNLISIHMLDNDGYSHSIGNDYWKLTKGSLVAAQGKLCYSLYKTHMKVCEGQLNTVEDDVSPNLWHKQLAHRLQLLAKQFLIPMTKDKLLNPYDHCLFRKHHRVSFQKNVNWKLEKLELVYYDVCGPMEVDSLGGNKYFVTFIDDASQKMWVYLLYTKKISILVFSTIPCHNGERDGKSIKTSQNR